MKFYGFLLSMLAVLGQAVLFPSLGYALIPGDANLASIPGDADNNGSVGFNDFLIVSGNYNSSANWSQGDFDGDGVCDDYDVDLLSLNFGGDASEWDPWSVNVVSMTGCNATVVASEGSATVQLMLDAGATSGHCRFFIETYDGLESVLVDAAVLASGDVQFTYHETDLAAATELYSLYPSRGFARIVAEGGFWGAFWDDYWFFLQNPSQMDPELEVAFYVSAGVAVTAGVAAGGLAVAGAATAGGAGGAGGASLTAGTVVNSNRLFHLFGQAHHNFGPLLARFGGNQLAAFNAIEAATVARLQFLGYATVNGLFETVIWIGPHRIVVQGAIINGVVKIGTGGM